MQGRERDKQYISGECYFEFLYKKRLVQTGGGNSIFGLARRYISNQEQKNIIIDNKYIASSKGGSTDHGESMKDPPSYIS